MAPYGRHLIETKDQKMFIMSIVQKNKRSENIISIVPQANKQDERGEKIMAPSGGETKEGTLSTQKWRKREKTYWLLVFLTITL